MLAENGPRVVEDALGLGGRPAQRRGEGGPRQAFGIAEQEARRHSLGLSMTIPPLISQLIP